MKKIFSFLTVFFAAMFLAVAKDPLPKGYKNIQFGMNIDQVKDLLKKDYSFGYRGDRDVSLLPGENRTLIETDTSRTAPDSFLERCWFQFYEDSLYIITINLRNTKTDHYSIFSSLMEKYGEPASLSPEKSEWNDGEVIMTLERPLTLKYTDRKVFDRLQKDSMVKKSTDEVSHREFLDSL